MAAMAPMIVLVLSVANVVHLVGQYRFERSRKDAKEALLAAFQEVGMACFLTSLTTLIGFSSLRFIPLVTAQELGVVCAVGVVASFLLAFTVVPILISYSTSPRRRRARARTWILNWCLVALSANVIFKPQAHGAGDRGSMRSSSTRTSTPPMTTTRSPSPPTSASVSQVGSLQRF